MTPKQGQSGKRAVPPDRRTAQRRLGVLVFGVLLVVLFVGVAVAQGIGDPEIPDGAIAVVEDAPDGTVTQEDLDAAMRILAAGQGLREPPAEDDPQFEQFEQAAASDAILARWVHGEAEDRGIEIFDREVDQALEDVINQQFRSRDAFDQYLDRTGVTEEQVRERLELERIGRRIQQSVLPEETEVSEDEIESYYEDNAGQFEQPETRDVRQILTKTEEEANEALAALEEDSSPRGWEQAAKQYSVDEGTKATGGLRPAVAQGESDPALDEQIFSAPEGELVGPFETDAGFYVIQVEKVNPPVSQSLDEVSDSISQIILGAREQQLATDFQRSFTTEWRARTFCADGYRIDRCSNAEPPASVCTEEVAESQGCGAPVPSTRPASPQLILPDPDDPAAQAPTPSWDVGAFNLSGQPVVYKPQGPTQPAQAPAGQLPPGLLPTAPGGGAPSGGAPPPAPPGG